MSASTGSSASRTIPETTIVHRLSQMIETLVQEFSPTKGAGAGAGTSASAVGVEESKGELSASPSPGYQAFITTASELLTSITTAYAKMAQKKYRDEANPREKKGKVYAEEILSDATKIIQHMWRWDWVNEETAKRQKAEITEGLNQLSNLASKMDIEKLATDEVLKIHWALAQLLQFATIKIHIDPIQLLLKEGFNGYLSFANAIWYITYLKNDIKKDFGQLVVWGIEAAVNFVVPDLLKSAIPSALVRSSESLQGLFQDLHARLENEGNDDLHIQIHLEMFADKIKECRTARYHLDKSFDYSLNTEFPFFLKVALAKSQAERDAIWKAAYETPLSREPSETRLALDPQVSLGSSHRDSEDRLAPSPSTPSPFDLVSSQSANPLNSPDYSDSGSDSDPDSDASLPESKPQAISATPAENPERTTERAPSGESLDYQLDADIGSSERHSTHLTPHPDPALREFYRELKEITIVMMEQEMSKKFFETDSKTLEKLTLLKNLMSKEPATVEELTKKLYQAERILSHKSFGFRFKGNYSEDFNRLHKGNFLTLRSKIQQSHPNLILLDQESGVLRPKPKDIPISLGSSEEASTPLFQSYKNFKTNVLEKIKKNRASGPDVDH